MPVAWTDWDYSGWTPGQNISDLTKWSKLANNDAAAMTKVFQCDIPMTSITYGGSGVYVTATARTMQISVPKGKKVLRIPVHMGLTVFPYSWSLKGTLTPLGGGTAHDSDIQTLTTVSVGLDPATPKTLTWADVTWAWGTIVTLTFQHVSTVDLSGGYAYFYCDSTKTNPVALIGARFEYD